MQPLAGEIVGESRGARIGDQALHLSVEYFRGVKLIGFGEAKEFVIRRGAPEEVAQARRKFQITDTRGCSRRRIALDAEQELRHHESTGDGKLQALLRSVIHFPGLLVNHR